MRSRFLFEIVLPVVIVCWAAVMAYSAVASDTGYRMLAALEEQRDTASAEVEALRARRHALEKRADLLNSKSLDPDLVEERIRSVLGYSREGDVVISGSELDRLVGDTSRK